MSKSGLLFGSVIFLSVVRETEDVALALVSEVLIGCIILVVESWLLLLLLWFVTVNVGNSPEIFSCRFTSNVYSSADAARPSAGGGRAERSIRVFDLVGEVRFEGSSLVSNSASYWVKTDNWNIDTTLFYRLLWNIGCIIQGSTVWLY